MDLYISCVFVSFLIELLSGASGSQAGDLPRPVVGCGPSIHKAEARTKYITTPGYPNAFPGDSTCTWSIYCEPGKRIRLEFQKFFLIQPVNGICEQHYVMIKTPFNSYSMGQYCGEVGLPSIISTGNLIYVELHTIASVSTDNYKGFKLAFKVTLESSSYELRPNNEVDDVIMTVDPATMNILSPTVPTTTTPRPTKSTTKPWRFVPPKRPLQNTLKRPPGNQQTRRRPMTRPTVRPNNNYYSNNGHRPTSKSRVVTPKQKDQPVNITLAVGIGVGGLVALAIIIAIALQLISKKKSSKNKTTQGNEKSATTTTPHPIQAATKTEQTALPGMYPDPNQYWHDGAYAYAMAPIAQNYSNNPPEYYSRDETKSTKDSKRRQHGRRKQRRKRRR